MPFIIQIKPGWYEKRTSTLRAFGGSFIVTSDINEAKRLSRKADADKRVKLMLYCSRGEGVYKKRYNPAISLIEQPEVKEI